MEIKWINEATISTRTEDDAIVISANKEGLLSLADIFKTMAEEEDGEHIHLDEYNSLEEGSKELIIEKTK